MGTIKLSDVTTKVGSGATPRGGKNAYKKKGLSLIRSQNVLDLEFNHDTAFIDEQQAEKLSNVTVKSRDLLLNITGDSVARVCMVPDSILPARVNQHVAIIRTDPASYDPEYLLYYLYAIKPYLLSISEIGGTRRAITKGMIEDLDLPDIDLAGQRAIARTLSLLDQKIQLLHQQNQTLEALGAAVFREWFLEGEEELDTCDLSDFGEIVCGKTPSKKRKDYHDGQIPFLRIPDMHSQIFIHSTTDSLTEAGRDSQSNKTLPPGAVCVSCIATVGLVSITTEETQTNQQINSAVY